MVQNPGTTVDLRQQRIESHNIFQAPMEFMRYIVPKGYIAIDGTSLTVCDVDMEACEFTFMLIEYTQKHVAQTQKPEGARVRLQLAASFN